MTAKIINYFVRLLIIGLGVYLLLLPADGSMKENAPAMNIMGVILILWGVYRIVRYRVSEKKYARDDDE